MNDLNERRYKWLEIYTLECTDEKPELIHLLPNIKKIEAFLKGDYSREKVRDYFFEVHNPFTFDFMQKSDDFRSREGVHLLLPYEVNSVLGDALACRLRTPFYELPNFVPNALFSKKVIDNAFLYEVFEDLPKAREIVLVHGRFIVDVVTDKDIKMYDYLHSRKK